MNIAQKTSEDVRTFFSRRTFLVGPGRTISNVEYNALMTRNTNGLWTRDEWKQIQAWVAGWMKAKG